MPGDDATTSVLVTGANGFVGTRLCRTFLSHGFHVIAGVRRTSNLSEIEKLNLECRFGDVTRPETLKDMVAGVDYIIHNAGVVKVKRESAFFEVNERGTLSLFSAIAEYNPGVKKVLYISSLAAAGPSDAGNPVTEDDPPRPITAYGRSKLNGESAALAFADRLNVLVVRPPGIYGPGDREIFSFFQTLNRRIRPYIGNINRRLQLVHVDDLCRGVYLAVTAQTKPGQIYFIAENRSYSTKEMIDLLERGCGKRAFPLVVPSALFKLIAFLSGAAFKAVNAAPMLTLEKARELLAWWEVSTDKAKNDFGFESKIPFEQGAKDTFDWYRREGWL